FPRCPHSSSLFPYTTLFRSRVVEDDPRYVALTEFLRATLVSIQDKWTDLRNEARGKQAISEIPALAEWLKELPPSQRNNAERLRSEEHTSELQSPDHLVCRL